jgi:nucleoside-diphosphate-sugar epimerase
VENGVDALLLCARAPAAALGKKYNITNGEPLRLWEIINRLCDALGYPRPQKHLPLRLADSTAALMEGIYRLIPAQPEPPLTRYIVSVVANSTTLDISAARAELGYQPTISIETGFQTFIRWWKETHP